MRAGHYHPTIRQTGALCPLPLGTSGKGFLERLPHTIYSLVNPLSIEFILAAFVSFGRSAAGRVAFPHRAKRFPRPSVLGLVMPQDVAVSVLHYHAEKCCAGRIPAVLHFLHLERPAPQHKSHRPFIGPVSRVTFHLNLPHRPSFRGAGFRAFTPRAAACKLSALPFFHFPWPPPPRSTPLPETQSRPKAPSTPSGRWPPPAPHKHDCTACGGHKSRTPNSPPTTPALPPPLRATPRASSASPDAPRYKSPPARSWPALRQSRGTSRSQIRWPARTSRVRASPISAAAIQTP